MRLTGLVLALAILGLEAVTVGRVRAGDRHCDYTRPGVEPWWRDGVGELGEPVLQPEPSVDTPRLRG